MSVFFEKELDKELKNAKGRAFFLDHSPDDTTCKFENAEKAQERLKKEGAAVELVTYKGGHGWKDDPYARLKKGFAWLEKNHAKPEKR
jgi:predicted esterase